MFVHAATLLLLTQSAVTASAISDAATADCASIKQHRPEHTAGATPCVEQMKAGNQLQVTPLSEWSQAQFALQAAYKQVSDLGIKSIDYLINNAALSNTNQSRLE